MKQTWELEELIEHFTVIPEEMRLIGNKYRSTRLGFAVSLKFFQYHGRFPKGRQDINQESYGYKRTFYHKKCKLTEFENMSYTTLDNNSLFLLLMTN